jgi:hypothetical protein
MKVVTVVALILLCISGPANATDKNHWMKDLFTGSFDVTARQDRLRIAQGIFAEINALKAYLPSLTPDQKRWLEAEKSSLDSLKGDAFRSKLNTFSQSSEFQLENFTGNSIRYLRR